MATLNVHIPYDRIARIAPVVAEKGEGIVSVAARVGADYVLNGGTYDLVTRELDSGLKIDGEYLMQRESHGLGIRADGKLEWSYGGKWTPSWIGYYSCGAADGKLYGRHITDKRQRTGMGITEDGIVLAATTAGMTTADFAAKYFAGCKAWINLDGGASTQWVTPEGRYTTSRKVMWYVCVWLIKDDNKNDGGKDMPITNLPLNGEITVTAGFGEVNQKYWKTSHEGVDLIAADKTVYSPCDGVVKVIEYDAKGWGRYVSIADAQNRRHLLCHLSEGSVKVKVGQKVTRTTVIGTMGSTGKSSGVHLHYQLNTPQKEALDPSIWMHMPSKRGVYKASDYAVDKDGKLLTAPTPPEPTNTPPNAQTNTPAALDNTPDAWAKDAVDRAVAAGVLVGDDKGDLKLHDAVTRQELAVMLMRAGVI